MDIILWLFGVAGVVKMAEELINTLLKLTPYSIIYG
jgi:uncharacterized protein (DUF302 family)